MNKNEQNILGNLLKLLNVKHTKYFTNKYFEEHPHKHDLYGLSSMLSTYRVESCALQIDKDSASLIEIPVPFVAYIKNDFILVLQISLNEVKYYLHKKTITVSMNEFIKSWSGVILIAEADEKSIEPNYHINRKKELFHIGKIYILFLSIIITLYITSINNKTQIHTSILTTISINIIGIYISYLILLKQMYINSSVFNKICSIFSKEKNCDNIIHSDSSTFFGILSWSEIGFGYFTTNLLITLYIQDLYPYLVIINILTLPYTFWSIWYQVKVAKQWCFLCVIIQILLWVLFLNNLLCNSFETLINPTQEIPLIFFLYLIPILLTNLTIPYLADVQKMSLVTQELNSLKANKIVFNSLQMHQPYYKINRSVGILWGNLNANNILTVITNPHCTPCAKMHKQLEDLLLHTENGYCIQYILVSFNKELEESNLLFIAMYQQMDSQDFLLFLNDWYSKGKNNHKEFYQKYSFNNKDANLLKELNKQNEWINTTSIQTTPTVLFNGYRLTDKYKINDLTLFTIHNQTQ